FCVDASSNQDAIDAGSLGAGDIGPQGISNGRNPLPRNTVERLEAGFVDRAVGLAVIADGRTQRFVTRGQGAGADFPLAAAESFPLRAGADDRQAERAGSLQLSAIRVDRILGHMRAGVQYEICLLEAVDEIEMQALAHPSILIRAEVETPAT